MKPRSQTRESIDYSFVPNHRATMYALARAKLTCQETRILLALMNQTNGYLRDKDKISTHFWQTITLMSAASINHTLNRLIKRGLILMEREGDRVFYWVAAPNDWPPDVFAPQRITKKALKEAEELLSKEKKPEHYAWLKNLLKTLSNQTTLSKPDTNLVQPDNTLVQPDKDLATKKPLESTKESTKESMMEAKASSSMEKGKLRVKGDPQVCEVFLVLEKERGYKSPNYGGEGKAAKWMLGEGYSVEDIMGCWRAMKRSPFWMSQELSLMSVRNQIGQWVKGGQRSDAFQRKGGARPGYGMPLPTGEEIERSWKEWQAQQLAMQD